MKKEPIIIVARGTEESEYKPSTKTYTYNYVSTTQIGRSSKNCFLLTEEYSEEETEIRKELLEEITKIANENGFISMEEIIDRHNKLISEGK